MMQQGSKHVKTDLLTEVDVVMDFIKKHINKEVIITSQAQNIQRWQYPLKGLRELIINMITHRDYSSAADSIVKIFDDRIEFFNPGTLPPNITVEKLLSNNYVSTPRNKLIADLFKEIGMIEKYGTGIKSICELFEESGLPKPVFNELQGGLQVVVYASTPQINVRLTTLEGKILNVVKADNTITQKRIAAELQISVDTVKEYIARLKKKGVLKRLGSDRYGTWEVGSNK